MFNSEMIMASELFRKNVKLVLTTLIVLFAIPSFSQILGCTDPLATNFVSSATQNDGTCTYAAASISASNTFGLPATVSETSGLIFWNGKLWTHNDDGDIQLYAIDTTSTTALEIFELTGTQNIDWEEISQDQNYIYVGDFGNNLNGNRTDLKILRVEKNSFLTGVPIIDTLNFSYSNQQNFLPTGANNTDFDCEAFFVSTDSIYLFTKQWLTNACGVYSISKIPGTHVAALKTTLNTDGLITGVHFNEADKVITLLGYSTVLQPFIYLLYDFPSTDFMSGNKRKISVSLPFYQTEGITAVSPTRFFISNEYFSQSIITTPQQLHSFDLSSFLNTYLTANLKEELQATTFQFHPNPAMNGITIQGDFQIGDTVNLFSSKGKLLQTVMADGNSELYMEISNLPNGVYLLKYKEFVLEVLKR
jgi:hypothetical protein